MVFTVTYATTPKLGIKLLPTNSLQPEITVNEALIVFDALAARVALDKDLNAPPGSPVAGDTYIIGSSPTGAWTGHPKKIAFYYNGWQILAPPSKMKMWLADESKFYTYTSPNWAADAAGTPTVLDDLVDVSAAGPSNDDVLTWETSTGLWKAKPVTAPAQTLAGLTDVNVTGVADGYRLEWDNGTSKWIAVVPHGDTLSSLSDVNLAGRSDGDLIMWDAGTSKYVFIDPSILDTLVDINEIGNVNTAGKTVNDALVWNGSAWAPSSGAINFTFENMTDGPGTMSGAAGKFLAVNSVETDLEYVSVAGLISASGVTLDALADVDYPAAPTNGQYLKWNSATSMWGPTTVTPYSDEMSQDALAAAFAAGTHTGITITYNDAANRFDFASTITQYTDEMAQDAISTMLAAGTHSKITVTYNDAGNAMSLAAVLDLQMRGGTPGRKPTAGEVLFAAIMNTGDSLPAGMTLSKIACAVAPTSSWTLTLKQNGTTIGTGTITAGNTTGTWTFASTVTFTNGDIFTGEAPATQDATLSGAAYAMMGSRTQ